MAKDEIKKVEAESVPPAKEMTAIEKARAQMDKRADIIMQNPYDESAQLKLVVPPEIKEEFPDTHFHFGGMRPGQPSDLSAKGYVPIPAPEGLANAEGHYQVGDVVLWGCRKDLAEMRAQMEVQECLDRARASASRGFEDHGVVPIECEALYEEQGMEWDESPPFSQIMTSHNTMTAQPKRLNPKYHVMSNNPIGPRGR